MTNISGLNGKLETETYSITIASAGHSPTQAPQSTHVSLLTSALPAFIAIASTGHADTHDSQPVHFALSTFAAIVRSPYSLVLVYGSAANIRFKDKFFKSF